jgi:sterol 24-C-methyltransferase
MGAAKRASSVVVLAFAVGCVWRGLTTQDAWYRLTTALQSLYNVSFMPQDKIDGFLKSYEIFEQDFFSGSEEEVKNLLAYYGVLNHLCAIGDFEKMYLPPRIDPPGRV